MMGKRLDCREEVLFYTKMLMRMRSVVNTNGEKEIAHSLHSLIAALPYFQRHPSQLVKQPTAGDERERYNVAAFVRGTAPGGGPRNETVILMGHIDTVGTEDYGLLEDIACEPEALKEALKREADVPEAVRAHLEDEEWLFGRGALDMKSGVAGHFCLLKYYAEHPEALSGNLVFLAECDEEDSSHGIRSAAALLRSWQAEHGFSYVAAINADFVAPRYPGDPHRYVYKGTVGKLLPAFYMTGAETHVGSCFEGFDPNLLAAELTRELDYNPELSNEADGELTAPPVALKQTDLKTSYSVQTALSAYAYYNFLVYSWSPREVLKRLRARAAKAFDRALALFRERYRAYCARSGEPERPLDWETRVWTYEELHAELLREHGAAYASHMAAFQESLAADRALDLRLHSLRVVEEAWRWMRDRRPAIVLFFASLYSPRVELAGKNAKERRLIAALDEAVRAMNAEADRHIRVKPFFPHISDMSFVSLSDDAASIAAETANNPAWPHKLFVDYDAIRALDVPVINIGPYGHDAHKKYERVEIGYSMEVVPNLTNAVIRIVLEGPGEAESDR